MEMDEVSERYIIPCFVNGLEAYDGEINLVINENLISNEYAVKLCLDYEVKKGNKVAKKEFIVALKGELYFVKFIINPKGDDVEPRVILGCSFMRLVNGIVGFGSGLDGEELLLFVCKMGKSRRNKKRAMENLNLFYLDIRPSSSTGRHLTQKEAAKEALEIRISQKFALLEEEAINKVKGKALKEKDDAGTFIFPIRFEGKINKNALADTGPDINTMPYRIYEKLGREEIKKGRQRDHNDQDASIVVGRGFLYTIGGIVNTPERLFSTFDGIFHQTFRATRSNVLRTAESDSDSDSDDEEEYEIKRNKFGAPIYGLKPAAYLNCNDPAERSLALKAVIHPFWKISVWKKVVSSLGSLLMSLQHVDWKPDYKGCYTNEEEAKGQWRTEIRTMGGNDDEARTSRFKCSRQYETVKEVLLLQVHHEFLLSKGCNKEAKSRLGLYHAEELYEEGFDVYIQGGLRGDDHFNAEEYWLSISRDENLNLSRSHVSNIRSPVLRVIYKMLTYGLCQRTIGEFIKKNAKKAMVLSDVVLRSLSALIYCRDLDTTTLRELINSEGRLILEDPWPGVPRVSIPRPPRESMQDLYDRMGNIEIRQGVIERMSYRQSYYWDMYAGVFKHMAGVYSVPLQGAYNPHGYAQPQYDQYYQ
nr:hypothetical protein [Tanacetum cinerariifolium]